MLTPRQQRAINGQPKTAIWNTAICGDTNNNTATPCASASQTPSDNPQHPCHIPPFFALTPRAYAECCIDADWRLVHQLKCEYSRILQGQDQPRRDPYFNRCCFAPSVQGRGQKRVISQVEQCWLTQTSKKYAMEPTQHMSILNPHTEGHPPGTSHQDTKLPGRQ